MALSRITLYGFLIPCQNLQNNDPILRKRLDRCKNGQTDGQKRSIL